MTGQEIYEIALTLMDEAPIDGEFDLSNTNEYKNKAPYLLDAIQSELVSYSNLYKTYSFNRKAIEPIVGSYNIEEHFETDIEKYGNNAAKAYYFEVNGPAIVYIEDFTDSWNIVETINCTQEDSFKAYSGKVTPTSGSTKSRIRFSGDYYYNFTNIALYKENFYGDVPEYREYVEITLPTDYDDLVEIIVENGNYLNGIDYKFEGKSLYIPYDLDGQIRIVYRPVPTKITALTQTLDLDVSLCRTVVPYALGARLISNENSAIASYLNQIYEENRMRLKKRIPSERTKIQDKYGANCNF